MKKNGFTLAEMLIVVALIGVLALLILPIIRKVMPNKEKVMFQKAYSTFSRAVSESVNDEDVYPESVGSEDGTVTDGSCLGVYKDETPYSDFGNTNTATVNGENRCGKTKFCYVMASKFNIQGNPVCPSDGDTKAAPTSGDPLEGDFTTTDGMVWRMPISFFHDANVNTTVPAYVDVNGDKGPNCLDTDEDCEKPDIFVISVYRDGRLQLNSDIAKEYLEVGKIH